MSKKRFLIGFVLLITAAVILAVVFNFFLPTWYSDRDGYGECAQLLFQARWHNMQGVFEQCYQPNRSILPLIASVLYPLFGMKAALAIISAIAFLVIVLLVNKKLKDVNKFKTVLILIIFNSTFIVYLFAGMTTLLESMLILLSALLFDSLFKSKNYWNGILAGLAIALLLLTRELVIVPLILAVYYFVRLFFDKSVDKLTVTKQVAIACIASLALLLVGLKATGTFNYFFDRLFHAGEFMDSYKEFRSAWYFFATVALSLNCLLFFLAKATASFKKNVFDLNYFFTVFYLLFFLVIPNGKAFRFYAPAVPLIALLAVNQYEETISNKYLYVYVWVNIFAVILFYLTYVELRG
jgi:MFS family permease